MAGVARRQSLRARNGGNLSPLGVREQTLTGGARGQTGTRLAGATGPDRTA